MDNWEIPFVCVFRNRTLGVFQIRRKMIFYSLAVYNITDFNYNPEWQVWLTCENLSNIQLNAIRFFIWSVDLFIVIKECFNFQKFELFIHISYSGHSKKTCASENVSFCSVLYHFPVQLVVAKKKYKGQGNKSTTSRLPCKHKRFSHLLMCDQKSLQWAKKLEIRS